MTTDAPIVGTVYPSVVTSAATCRVPMTMGIAIMSSISKSVSMMTQEPGAAAGSAVAGAEKGSVDRARNGSVIAQRASPVNLISCLLVMSLGKLFAVVANPGVEC